MNVGDAVGSVGSALSVLGLKGNAAVALVWSSSDPPTELSYHCGYNQLHHQSYIKMVSPYKNLYANLKVLLLLMYFYPDLPPNISTTQNQNVIIKQLEHVLTYTRKHIGLIVATILSKKGKLISWLLDNNK